MCEQMVRPRRKQMKSLARLISFMVILLVNYGFTEHEENMAGSTVGSISVNSSGGAIYEIPVELPPGTNGFEPGLSLRYDSHHNNGLLGMGWGVKGIPSIARCAQTIAQDKQKAGVNFNNSDRFCVDSERLVAISGDYGEEGTEYRTERESFTKYISLGQCGSGPCSFRAVSKDGHIAQFGVSDDARILASGKSTARIWTLNRLQDKNGNFFDIQYHQSTDNSEYYPVTLRYTGNDVGELEPARSITFDYENRPDISQSFVNGSIVKQTKRLKTITTRLNGEPVKSYNLDYKVSLLSSRSLLVSIRECDRNNQCLNPTTFNWNNQFSSQHQFKDSVWSNAGSWQNNNFGALGDYNGDGKSDLAYVYNSSGKVAINTYLSDGSALTMKDWSSTSATQFGGEFSNDDVNGDGLTDIIHIYYDKCKDDSPKECHHDNNGSLHLLIDTYLSNGNGFDVGNWYKQKQANQNNSNRVMGDFNGDGLYDIAIFHNIAGKSALSLYLSNGTSFELASWEFKQKSWVQGQYRGGDFNGDGLTDIAFIYNSQQKLAIDMYLSNGNGFIASDWSPDNIPWSSGNLISVSDYNGDAVSDIAYFRNNVGRVEANSLISSGNGFSAQIWSKDDVDWRGSSAIKPGDYNGDGLTDISYIAFEGSNQVSMTVYLSTGTSFLQQQWSSYTGSWNGDNYFPSDFSGDGTTDIADIANNIGKVNINVHVAAQSLENQNRVTLKQSDLLSMITTGIGGVTNIAYKPITDASVYNKFAPSDYPNPTIEAAWYVVSSMSIGAKDDKNTQRFEYSYQDAKVNLLGRGWIGFAKITTTDKSAAEAELHTQTTNHFYQDFPLTGILTRQTIVRLSDQAILRENNSSYDFVKSDNGVYTIFKQTEENKVFSNGNYNYTLKTDYDYSPDYMNVVLLSETSLPEPSDFFVCYQYDQNPDVWWQRSFPIAMKMTRNKEACSNSDYENWNEQTDLRLKQVSYDERMNQSELRVWNDVKAKWLINKVEYDHFGNTIASIDPVGNITKTVYDQSYQTFPVKQILPKANSTKASLSITAGFDARFGTITSLTGVDGNLSIAIPDGGIDGFGRVLSVDSTRPDSRQMVRVLERRLTNSDGNGLIAEQWMKNDWDKDDIAQWFWQRVTFNAHEQPIASVATGPADSKTISMSSEYDSRGLMIKTSLPYFSDKSPHLVSFSYDVLGRKIQTTLPDETVYQTRFNLHNNSIIEQLRPNPAAKTAKSALNPVSSFSETNSRGLLIRTKAANGGENRYAYDPLGQLIDVIDPIGNKTSYRYDSEGQVITASSPELGLSKFSYTDNGYIKTVINGNDEQQVFSYDGLGRITIKQNYLDDQSLSKTVRYQYDDGDNGMGRLTAAITADVTYRYQYDNLGRISEKLTSLKVNDKPQDYTTLYRYDVMDRIKWIQYPDNSIVRYNYLKSGDLASIGYQQTEDSEGIILAEYTDYTALGKSGNGRYHNGVSTSEQFDILGRPISSRTLRQSLVYRDHDLTWNGAGKLVNISDKRETPATLLSQQYDYNEMGFLTAATGAFGTTDYQYNLTGDITQSGNRYFGYNLQKKHQLESVCNGSRCDTSNAIAQLQLSYDGVGDLIGRTAIDDDGVSSGQIYQYDMDGNLIGVQKKQGVSVSTVKSYSYDDSWQRIIATNEDGKSTYYVSPYYILNDDGTGNIEKTKYVYGTDGAIAAIEQSGRIHYLNLNQIGSTTLVTDKTGAQTSELSYHPYGEIDYKNSQNIDVVRPKYSGKELDPDTGFYYFGARYYDPEIKRFITPDPAGQFDSSYLYAADDPITIVDPDGRVAGVDDAIEIAALITMVTETAEAVAGSAAVAGSSAAAATGASYGIGGLVEPTNRGRTVGMVGRVQTAANVSNVTAASATINSGANMAALKPAMMNSSVLSVIDSSSLSSQIGANTVNSPMDDNSDSIPFNRLFLESLHQKVTVVAQGRITCEQSFVKDTLVASLYGPKQIQNIEVGNEVWSWNSATNKIELKPVTRIFNAIVDKTVRVETATAVLESTDEHPFYIENSGWANAAELSAGTGLVTMNKDKVLVTNVSRQQAPQKVYNFEVADNHNYFAGKDQLLVHNGICRNIVTDLGQIVRQELNGATARGQQTGRSTIAVGVFRMGAIDNRRYKAVISAAGRGTARGRPRIPGVRMRHITQFMQANYPNVTFRPVLSLARNYRPTRLRANQYTSHINDAERHILRFARQNNIRNNLRYIFPSRPPCNRCADALARYGINTGQF